MCGQCKVSWEKVLSLRGKGVEVGDGHTSRFWQHDVDGHEEEILTKGPLADHCPLLVINLASLFGEAHLGPSVHEMRDR